MHRMQKSRTFNPTLDKIPYLFPRAARHGAAAGVCWRFGPRLFHPFFLPAVREKNRRISNDGNAFRSFLLRKSRLDSSRSISLPRWKYHASTKFYNFLNVREYFLKRSGSLFKRDGRIRMVNIEIINFR